MNPMNITVTTPLLVFAIITFVWTFIVHSIEGTEWGSKIPESLRPKLAMLGGLLLGVTQAIVQGQPWVAAVVQGLITGTIGMGGVSAPVTPQRLAKLITPALLAQLGNVKKSD